MADAVSIYRLVDPREPARVRYVGKTACSLATRLRRHLNEARRGLKAHRYHWIRGLLADGVRPAIELIELCSASEWQAREKHWIAELRAKCHPLTNTGPGGDGMDSDAWREVWQRPGQRDRQSKALIAYNADPAVRERKRTQGLARWSGKPRSRQRLTSEAYSAAQVGAWERHAGRRTKQSAASRARWADPTYRARVSAVMRAAHKPEHHQRRSDATKRGWETRRANKERVS